jgi:anti-sigma factor RsiW
MNASTLAKACEQARALLAERRRGGALAAGDASTLAEHLEGCAACRHEDAAERALDDALATRLPRHAPPASLRRRLEAEVAKEAPATKAPAPPARARPWLAAVPALAAGLAIAAGVAVYYERVVVPGARATAQLEAEVVNDHLRILYSERPLEVESGGIHQVKPWFAGRVDFAPVLPFAGDDEFPLQGGAVSYVLDRKAAAFLFKRRLHTMTVLVFRADGLAWPTDGLTKVGRVMAEKKRVRGFNLLLWRDGELGYAIVSDVDPSDVDALAAKIAPAR